MARARRVRTFTYSLLHCGREPEGNDQMVKTAPIALAAVVALAAGPAAAQDRPVLTVYTYDSFASEWGPGPALKAEFEKTCGCTVEFNTADDAISVLRKVQLEGATTAADVIVGLDTATAPEARATASLLGKSTGSTSTRRDRPMFFMARAAPPILPG